MLALCIQCLALIIAINRPDHAYACGALVVLCFAWQIQVSPRLALRAVLVLVLVTLVSLHTNAQLARDRLHPALAGVTVPVRFVLLSSPREGQHQLHVRVRQDDPSLPAKLSISWPQPAVSPEVGTCWQARVRLGELRGFRNPGVFDYVRWATAAGLGGRGQIALSSGAVPCADYCANWQDRVRTGVASHVRQVLGQTRAASIITALAIGDRSQLDPATQDALRQTGTAHLMAISGLHIGLVAMLGGWLMRRVGPIGRFPAQDLAIAAGLAGATTYALVSGLALPAQRALLMLGIAACIYMVRRRFGLIQLASLAAIVISVLAPSSVLSASFWLSFAAVFLIALLQHVGTARAQPVFGSRVAVHIQVLLTLALTPVTAYWFGYAVLFSLPANLVLVPLFGFVVVPLVLLGALAGAVFAPLAIPFWLLASHIVEAALVALDWLHRVPNSVIWLPSTSAWLIVATTMAVAYAVLCIGWPGRLAALCTIAVLAVRSPSPAYGCMRLQMLDVGHGTAITMQTANHWFVFDTGPAWRSGGDAGARIVLPVLRAQGAREVTLALVSHDDNDHSGGVASLRKTGLVRRWLGSAAGAEACRRGLRWSSDGIGFEVLWPPATLPHPLSDNDASCVLKVSAAGLNVLLSGDIEGFAERSLVAAGGLASTLLSMPHHGSRTSSSKAFINAVAAKEVWASASDSGRWILPAPVVSARWHDAGVRVATTAQAGALGVTLCDRQMRR
ncbi:MAG: DNA internalization-related competence protein ComEC/Rec2 [Pseudomonadota bacterium]